MISNILVFIVYLFHVSSLSPVVLSTWGRFITNECESLSEVITAMPIIVATNLRVKDINGKLMLNLFLRQHLINFYFFLLL